MLFSVIVPSYNTLPYLQIAIKSLLGQSFSDWECICVDDGSTDGTEAFLKECSWIDKRIRFLKGTHGGVAKARNMAINVARGQYLMFLDSDDTYVSNALEYLSVALQRHAWPDVFSYRSVAVTSHQDNTLFDRANVTEKYFDLRTLEGLRGAFKARLGDLIAWNACWRRDSFDNPRFEIMPNGEDILWGMHRMMEAKTMVCSSACIYRYLHRQGSALQTISYKHAVSAIFCFRRMAESAARWDRRGEVSDVLFKRILCQALGYVRDVLSRLPFSDRLKLRGEFLNALNFLCCKSGLLHGCQRLYFGIAVSNLLTRLLMLYLPFDLYALRHRGRK